MIIPHDQLSDGALRGLVEEFVTRHGTDSGYASPCLEDDVQRVLAQLRRGEVRVTYDPATQTAGLIAAAELSKPRSPG
ncbi:MAG: YheU family protein [Desulfobacterales bacterium]|jgi:uncharacterized protein YheU (UPF0270 family)